MIGIIAVISAISNEDDRKKFTALYEKYGNFMLYIARTFVSNHSYAEDIVHDAFLQIIKSPKRIRTDNEKETRAYLAKVVQGNAMDFLKKHAANFDFESIEDIFDSSKNITVSVPEEYTLNNEMLYYTSVLINRSTPFQKSVFEMRYENYPYVEIAEILHCSEAACRKAFERTRKILLNAIEVDGYAKL